MKIVLLETPPPVDAQWEDIVEVSMSVPEGAECGWMSWAGETGGPLNIPPGTYRARMSARGRDAGQAGEFAEEAVDFYLLELWPAPPTVDAIIKVGSQDAEYWHREIGSRR